MFPKVPEELVVASSLISSSLWPSGISRIPREMASICSCQGVAELDIEEVGVATPSE